VYTNKLLFEFLQYLFNPVNNFSKEYIAERIAGAIIKYCDTYKDIKEKMNYAEYVKEHTKIKSLILSFFNTIKDSDFKEFMNEPLPTIQDLQRRIK
jgi:hypothetical protein